MKYVPKLHAHCMVVAYKFGRYFVDMIRYNKQKVFVAVKLTICVK